MYESPITAMISDITTEMQQEQDREIMNAILSVGISVDKDELVKALSYDRQQYGKGYAEGYAAAQADTPHWISVEERLPEGNGTRYEYDLEESNLVLVYGINHIGEMAYGLGRYIYDHDDPKDSGWNGNMDCDYDLDYCTVTHWMPLPAPPKEVE